MPLSEKLKIALEERGLTQASFASMSGLTRACVCRLCKGERMPRYSTLVKVCNALDVPLDYFNEKNTD